MRSAGPTLSQELNALGYEIAYNEYFTKKSDVGHYSRRALTNGHRFWSVLTAVKASRFKIEASREINYFAINYYQYNKVTNSRK